MTVASSSDPVVTRLGTEADDPRIARLIAQSAPGNPKADLEVLRWQYRSARFGPTVTVVAESLGEVVGHYSAISVPVRVDGAPVRAARGVDIVTAPGHRGKGVFRAMADRLSVATRDAGFELVLSTPNDSSRAVLESTGWSLVGDPRPMVVVVDAGAVIARAPVPVPRAVADLAVRAISARGGTRRLPAGTLVTDDIPADLGRLGDMATPTTGIVRDDTWWRWRYVEHPRRPYRFVEARRRGELVGAGVISRRDDPDGVVLQLLDLVAIDSAAAREVVRATVGAAADMGAGAVVAAALPGSAHAAMLQRSGFFTVPRSVQPRPIHLLVADLTGRRPGIARRRWAFSLGDQDHL